MAKAPVPEIKWLPDVEEHDYAAAESYLRLLFDDPGAAKRVAALRETVLVQFKAKDIFRASRLPLLGVDNSHVAKDLKKMDKGLPLSPLLLVRGRRGGRLVIADGYHRLCAVYSCDEDAAIRCRII